MGEIEIGIEGEKDRVNMKVMKSFLNTAKVEIIRSL